MATPIHPAAITRSVTPAMPAQANAEPIVSVRGLVKRYGGNVAVNGISFEIRQGEIFGLLGPNGAGKTTTLEILEGIRTADSGDAHIAGLDVRRQRRAVQRHIGVQLQATTLFSELNVRETIKLFGAFYPHALDADELLREVALTEKSHAFPQDLSGGQRQRLALALALVNDPDVIFLDEPTSGLDPQSRHMLWESVLRLRERGKTIVLTTHFMDEAQILSDRIAILDHGEIIAQDAPAELIGALGASAAIECTLTPHTAATSRALQALPAVSSVRAGAESTILYTTSVEETLTALIQYASAHGAALDHVRVDAPTLEDVFLRLTGRGLRD